ncbi:MAG: RNA-binding protein [Dehalococcoidia bacterium]
MKLYVGNLNYSVTDDDLREAFATYGQVDSARVVTDRDTNRSRGFGFVEMADDAGRTAIQGLDGRDLQGRALTVNEARPQEDRPRRQFRQDGGGSRGGGHRRF